MEGSGRGKACAVHDNIHSLLSLLDQELQENQKRLTTDEPVVAPQEYAGQCLSFPAIAGNDGPYALLKAAAPSSSYPFRQGRLCALI